METVYVPVSSRWWKRPSKGEAWKDVTSTASDKQKFEPKQLIPKVIAWADYLLISERDH